MYVQSIILVQHDSFMNYLPYGTCTQGTGRIGPGIEGTICPGEHGNCVLEYAF
jgi:hypothetical protein